MLVPLSSPDVTTVDVDVGGQKGIEGGLRVGAMWKLHWFVVDASDTPSSQSKVEIKGPSFATGLFDPPLLSISR